MAIEGVFPAAATPADAGRVIRRRSGFYFGASIALLLSVLIGFAPTLYLRALFPGRPIGGHLYVHGAILTGWFVWLVVQTSLVRTGRTIAHRRMGIVGAILGFAVMFAGLLATLNVVHGIRAAGITLDMDISALRTPGLGSDLTIGAFLSPIIWLNLASILAFAILFITALVQRGRPEAHKRLMLLASICIVGPALARVARWPVFGGEQGPFVPVVITLSLVAMVVNDLRSTGRANRVTLAGIGFIVLAALCALSIGNSQFGQAFVRELQ